MEDNLIDGEYYWIRPKPDMGFNGYDESMLLVGEYDLDWTYPTFNLCGDDLLHAAYKFDVIQKIERPHE